GGTTLQILSRAGARDWKPRTSVDLAVMIDNRTGTQRALKIRTNLAIHSLRTSVGDLEKKEQMSSIHR
ncbi:hypothetical protein Moror_15906, partial [Moniliophthora roreri MCA 2997]